MCHFVPTLRVRTSRLTIHTGMRAVVFIGGISDIFSVTSRYILPKCLATSNSILFKHTWHSTKLSDGLTLGKTLLWSIGVPNSGDCTTS